MSQLSREEVSNLKKLAQQKNYDAIVALLDYTLSQTLDTLVKTANDHRYVQGGFNALKDFRDNIVRTLK